MMRLPGFYLACYPLIFLLFAFSHLSLAEDPAEPKADQLFQEGYVLYQRHFSPEALQRFQKSAELGHVEAAYYAGEIIRIGHTFITPESEKWYRMAAEGGDVYAMLRLANADVCKFMTNCHIDKDEWFERALKQTLPQGEAGDTEAMNALYSIYGAKGDEDEAWEWLNRAASKGSALAQYLKSHLIRNGYSFYWTDAGRTEDAIYWMRESAKSGFPKAMDNLARMLRENGQMEEARYWVREMGETDYFTAIYRSGLALVKGSDSLFQFPNTDKTEGLAMLRALHRETGSSEVEFAIELYSKELSPQVLEAARERSEELLVDMPVMYYDPKFGL